MASKSGNGRIYQLPNPIDEVSAVTLQYMPP